MSHIESALSGIAFFKDELLSRHTTFRIGGPADYFVCPENTDELKRAVSADDNVFIIGNGSNLLFPDDGYRGVVIKYCDSSIVLEGNKIICGSGAIMSTIASVAYENSLCGFEFASGIPGSIGGGVRMNAGAYGGSLDNVVVKTEYLDIETNDIRTVVGSEHGFGYRHSVFCDNPKWVITKVVLQLSKGDQADIKALMDDFTLRRTTKQPLRYPSAGSVFKRPEGYFAGALIEQSGLKGYSVGGAQISELHAGFIINTGDATCEDVKQLIKHIQKTVFEKFGVMLECEICIL